VNHLVLEVQGDDRLEGILNDDSADVVVALLVAGFVLGGVGKLVGADLLDVEAASDLGCAEVAIDVVGADSAQVGVWEGSLALDRRGE